MTFTTEQYQDIHRVLNEEFEALGVSDQEFADHIEQTLGYPISWGTIRRLRIEFGIPSKRQQQQAVRESDEESKFCRSCELYQPFWPPPTKKDSKASGFHGLLCWGCWRSFARECSTKRGANNTRKLVERAEVLEIALQRGFTAEQAQDQGLQMMLRSYIEATRSNVATPEAK